MAKSSIGQVTTTQTFQNWLDKTNQIVTLLETDVLTASTLGDTTTGNATLIGSFTANTVIAFDTLRADTISPKIGSTSIGATAPINITTSLQVAQTLTSTVGPRLNLSSGSVTWRTGFENNADNNFIIDSGVGTVKLRLTPTGNLSVAGTISNSTAGGTLLANLTGNVTGDVTGNVTGDVTGTVSSLSNHTTSNLAEGTNLYFTNARSRGAISVSGALSYNSTTGVISITDSGIRALFSGGTGVSYNSATGDISIGQAVATTSNVTFANLTTTGTISSNGTIYSNGDIVAFASSSDIRKKENISKIDNALEKVMSVNGYTYNFIGDDRRITGVIAQEIEEILPEAVHEIDDELFGKSKAVRYGNIAGLLIEAIKELKNQLDEVKERSI